MISGGEPLLSPLLLDYLKYVRDLPSVYLITNGIRMAEDYQLVLDIKKACPNINIYLQFDSLRSESIKRFRGKDLLRYRKSSLENIIKAGLMSKLVCVIDKMTTQEEISEVLHYALDIDSVDGVAFQPLISDKEHHIGLTDVAQNVFTHLNKEYGSSMMNAHPHNKNVQLGYLDRNNRLPVTENIFDRVKSSRFMYLENCDYFLVAVMILKDSENQENEPFEFIQKTGRSVSFTRYTEITPDRV